MVEEWDAIPHQYETSMRRRCQARDPFADFLRAVFVPAASLNAMLKKSDWFGEDVYRLSIFAS